MSIRSKAKRDAQKKKAARDSRDPAPRAAIEPHAELRDQHGKLLGGIARKDEEWVLGLDGQIVGGSASAATILTMLKRAASMQERAGNAIVLKFSKALRDAADEEARAQGMTLDQFESQLDQHLRDSGTADGGDGSSPSPARH
ncbi:MAG: hypothetical protein H0W24_01620 [Lysobacter sp.]|nr:hypothetical protein [Lysobacter sp.]MDQ3268587.1 hypothetical protein [Pseudomonadota bacterium]